MSTKKWLLRAGAGAIVGAMALAGTAYAENGTIWNVTYSGADITLSNGDTEYAGLIELNTASGNLYTYCLDEELAASGGDAYTEGDASGLNPAVGRIFAATYPGVTLDELATASGATLPLSQSEAAAGTQAALWFYTNGVTLTSATSNIQKVYEYLKGIGASGTTNAATVSITPASLSGEVGQPVGPFTLNTNAASATVTVSAGATIVDGVGAAFAPTHNGDVFYVVPGSEGTFNLTATASRQSLTGIRYFTSNVEGQDLAVPLYGPTTAEAAATVDGTTTTTTSTTTTTTSTTTTTIPETTTSTTSTTSTTTSTTAATTTSTTAAPTTSTTAAPTTTVAVAQQPIVIPVASGTLPRTGSNTSTMLWMALALFTAGSGAVLVGMRRRPAGER